jgi:hypothetical protein
MSILMNFRVPTDLKTEFQSHCKENHTYMTTEIIRFMKSVVRSDRHDKHHFQEEVWGSLIKDPHTGIWRERR